MARNAHQDQRVDPGAMLAATHELDDGSRVRLRLARPTDFDRIETFLDDQSSATDARDLAFYDPRERLTLAATRPGPAGGEEIAGLAAVALDDDGAEVLVADDDLARSLDSLLSRAATAIVDQRRRGAA